MTSTSYQKQHLKSLTGLRFLAALAVFIAHIPGRWPEFELGDLPFGAAGVGFFYVLSGFILTYVYGARLNPSSGISLPSELRDTNGGQFAFGKFYLRRFARIWPLHLVTLLISLFFVIGVESFFNRPDPWAKLFVNAGLLQSWVPSYDWIYSLNGPAWSLSVEAFFYLMFPLLLLGGVRKFVGKYVLIVIGTIVSLFAIDRFVSPEAESWFALNAIVHTFPPMRLFEFATGVGCGFWYLSRPQPERSAVAGKRDTTIELGAIFALIAFFATASGLGLYSAQTKYGVPEAFWYWFRFCGAAPVFALIVLVFASTRGVVSRVLSCRPVVYLGEISYSLYMIHMSVMLLLARQNWVNGSWVTLGIVGCSFVFSIFLASALYQLIELPCRRWIVGVCEGQGAGFVFRTIGNSFVQWIRLPGFVPLLVLALVAGWFATSCQFDIRSASQIDQIISSTPAPLQEIHFEDDATLRGIRTSATSHGGLAMEMVWQLRTGRRSLRVIKLLDANGKVIGRGNPNRPLFDVVQGDEMVIDRVVFKPDQLEGVEAITVGFFDTQRKYALIDRGPRSAGNRQLHVWRSAGNASN